MHLHSSRDSLGACKAELQHGVPSLQHLREVNTDVASVPNRAAFRHQSPSKQTWPEGEKAYVEQIAFPLIPQNLNFSKHPAVLLSPFQISSLPLPSLRDELGIPTKLWK